jgi:uncharacterized protein (TIGR03435 family)
MFPVPSGLRAIWCKASVAATCSENRASVWTSLAFRSSSVREIACNQGCSVRLNPTNLVEICLGSLGALTFCVLGGIRHVFQVMRRLTPFVTLFSMLAWAQTPVRFEVASVRPTTSVPTAGTSVDLLPGGRLRIVNEPVKLLIRLAFQLQDSQIAGAPAWLDADRFDIEARTGFPEKPPPGQISPILQDLLADRFHLEFHREAREISVYALVLAKGGHKLKPAADGESSGMNTETGRGTSHLAATASSLDVLAKWIGNRVGRIVLDQTGLEGAYDFSLTWSPNPGPDSADPTLPTALNEQLGLRLASRKAPVEVLVIDGIRRPTAN